VIPWLGKILLLGNKILLLGNKDRGLQNVAPIAGCTPLTGALL
jgi:hypothetical protein